MCEVKKSMDVVFTFEDVKQTVNEMLAIMSQDERKELIGILHQDHEDIIHLLSLDHESQTGKFKTCNPYWSDEELYKMIRILFNPRGILSKGQIIAAISDIVINN